MAKLEKFWLDLLNSELRSSDWWNRKKALHEKRGVEVTRINGKGRVFQTIRYGDEEIYSYLMHLSFLIKQGDHFYLEEQVIPYQFQYVGGEITQHREMRMENEIEDKVEKIAPDLRRNDDFDQRFSYDRLAAVQYAERWWNSYNPKYHVFDVDCTNYVSQCLFAGGAPMRGAPNREHGWWYENDNWSYSWAVAHSLRWYLSGSNQGLQGKEVQSPEELSPGDLICYDFQGDGRWDHNTIVVDKDASGMPLVNAHTDNSRHRYWSYEDSTAWTPDIQYKFFQIGV